MSYKVDYAKSGYSTCRSCESKNSPNNKIAKGTIRIARVQQADRFDNTYENWHHIDCFFDGEGEKPSCLDVVVGIQRLRHVDQLLIKEKIKDDTDSEIPAKRLRTDNADEVDSSDLDATIALQNEQYYRIYDAMNEKNKLVKERQKKKLLVEILELNKQARLSYRRDSTQKHLEHVVDIITFGAMEPCSECTTGGYIFDGTYGYVCNKRLYKFDGVKCDNRKMSPERFTCIIPDEIMDIYPILREPRNPTIRALYKFEPPRDTPKAVSSSTPMKVASSKQILKYGTIVDSLSGLEKEAHVLCHNGVEYAAILSKTKIHDNKNGYYKIQLLESDDFKKYWVFIHYGRIGFSGTHKLEDCSSLEEALHKFNYIYEKQTGNTFGLEIFGIIDPDKFVKLDIDYGDEVDTTKLMTSSEIPSALPESVQQLVLICFDVRNMKDMMIQLELDLERMPLGKLSKDQIEEGMEILNEILVALLEDAPQHKFIALSNRFYTLIPHDYGPEQPPVIRNLLQIHEKLQVLADLSNIQLAYSFLSTESDETKSPIDNCYDKLKTDIEPLDRSSNLFKFLERYVVNTHAPTHNFKLIVEEIFKITRIGEADRYEQFKNTENRYLLWHGSRSTNFVGILTNGLKIAPPRAERTGDMFGNGIYFSDVVTKSAQYCNAERNGHGLLLLCEVALGEIENCVEGFQSPRSTSDKSVKGCGQTYPNPDENVIGDDGVIVPCGKLVTDHSIQSELKYNEFIVYDESKVNIKYLFKVKFERKNGEN